MDTARRLSGCSPPFGGKEARKRVKGRSREVRGVGRGSGREKGRVSQHSGLPCWPAAASPDSTFAPLPQGPPGQEFYVKWRGRSYLHCSWVPEQAVQNTVSVLQAATTAGLRQRVSKFWRERQAGGGLAGADEDGEEGEGGMQSVSSSAGNRGRFAQVASAVCILPAPCLPSPSDERVHGVNPQWVGDGWPHSLTSPAASSPPPPLYR